MAEDGQAAFTRINEFGNAQLASKRSFVRFRKNLSVASLLFSLLLLLQ